ncbi:uncharacterized protein [Hetaerina americana]|uniref:uncharacterized protein n=1 Tax=Hetaerina americana TaxID=62018 RepID=UPI003A7F46CF
MHNAIIPFSFFRLCIISMVLYIVDCWSIPPTTAQLPKVEVKPAIPRGINLPANESAGHVLETHHTTCQITTEELVATAQATATRVLTGLCNSREMEDRFKALEVQISNLLNVLKATLADLEGKISNQNEVLRVRPRRVQVQPRAGDYIASCATGGQCPMEGGGTSQEFLLNTEKGKASGHESEGVSIDSEVGPREEEISRFNNTVHMEPFPDTPIKNAAILPLRVFSYYWRIHGIAAKINSWESRRSLRSPSFYTTPGGYRMYLLAFPRQNYENLYVHVGITSGMNDGSLQWPFPLKHRIQLLDQVKVMSNSSKKRFPFPSRPVTPVDLSSRLWNPALMCSASVWRRPIAGDSTECVGLGFPHDVLKSRNYIHDDSIVVKLTVYLG